MFVNIYDEDNIVNNKKDIPVVGLYKNFFINMSMQTIYQSG